MKQIFSTLKLCVALLLVGVVCILAQSCKSSSYSILTSPYSAEFQYHKSSIYISRDSKGMVNDFCSAFVVSSNVLITSAHCLGGAKKLLLFDDSTLGWTSSMGTMKVMRDAKIKKIIPNDLFASVLDESPSRYDLSVVILKSNPFSSIKPLQLDTTPISSSKVMVQGSSCRLMGVEQIEEPKKVSSEDEDDEFDDTPKRKIKSEPLRQVVLECPDSSFYRKSTRSQVISNLLCPKGMIEVQQHPRLPENSKITKNNKLASNPALGSPLVREDDNYKVVGVASNMNLDGQETGGGIYKTCYVSLTDEKNISFLKRVIRDEGISINGIKLDPADITPSSKDQAPNKQEGSLPEDKLQEQGQSETETESEIKTGSDTEFEELDFLDESFQDYEF